MALTRFHEAFDQWLQRTPQRTFLHLPDRDISYAALGAMVDLLQQELHAEGVVPGDRVIVVAENCPEHVALILACSRIGAWVCGINSRMAAAEVDAFVLKSDARIVYFTAAESTAAAEHGRRHAAQPSCLPRLQRGAARPSAVAEQGPEAERIAAIIFTSGTTGRPKGVLVSHEGLLDFGRASAQSRALHADDRAYAYVPMTHSFGIGTVLSSALYSGSTLVMRNQFSPEDLLDALARHRVSMLQGPPMLFARLLAHLDCQPGGRIDAPQLRYLYTGAGPLDMALKERVEAALNLPLNHGYAASEALGICVTRMDGRRADASAGHLLDGMAMRIVDSQGRDVAAGQRGEIWVRGCRVTPGYFRDPEASRQAFRDGGWFATGDLGELGPDGALFVVGRLKEMIIRSGFNVYPGEVEAAINRFPSVQRSAVVGRREADGNEQVVAFIELRPGMRLDEAALRSFLRELLSPYKLPAELHVVRSFPMTDSGKILKRELVAGPTAP